MTQITGGKVSYGRTAKVAEYESKRADVELVFAVGDGESHEEILDKVLILAQCKVLTLLGLPAEQLPTRTVVTEVVPAISAPAEPKATRRGRPPKAVEDAPAISTGEERVNHEEVKADPPIVPGIDDFETDGPAKITDADLSNALNRKNNEIKNGPKIRELVARFAGPQPKSARDIPQERRAEFLIELKALT